jgi:putative transposase
VPELLTILVTGRSVKELTARAAEAIREVISIGESSLSRVLQEYSTHYHHERNHQGKATDLFPKGTRKQNQQGSIYCRQRLGGLLQYYGRAA